MKMEVAAQKPSLLKRPLGIALAIWGLNPVGYLTLVLVAVAMFSLFSLKRPVWAVVALLVSQLTVPSHMINTPFGIPISLRLLLLILTGLILWRSFAQGQVELGPKARRLLIPLLLLLGVSVIANVINTDFDNTFRDFRNMVVGLLIVIFLPAATRNLKELKIVCIVAFIVMTASAVVGLMQYYQILGMDTATIIPNYAEAFTVGSVRISGMTETYLELAFVIPISILAVLGIYLAKGVKRGNAGLMVLSLLVMVAALYFTYTRSALLGVLLGLLAMVLFLKTRIRWQIIVAVLLLGVILIQVTGLFGIQYLAGRDERIQEESAIEKKILWQVGVAIAMDNPIIGIGGGQFKGASVDYASSVDPELLVWEEEHYWGFSTLGSTAIHNDFLRVWVGYGTFALLAYLWFLIAALMNFFDSYRTSRERFIRGLSVGLAAAVAAYAVNALYHNVMSGMPLLWILAALSLATTKLAFREKKVKQLPGPAS
jgi:O-antigen ligase